MPRGRAEPSTRLAHGLIRLIVLLKITPVNTVIIRRKLADAAVAKGGYIF